MCLWGILSKSGVNVISWDSFDVGWFRCSGVVRVQVRVCGIAGGGSEAGFSRVECVFVGGVVRFFAGIIVKP